MEKPKYTAEGLPIVSEQLADQHIEEVRNAIKQRSLEKLLFIWRQQIVKEQSTLGNYMVTLAKEIDDLGEGMEVVKQRLMGYQYGFSDTHYLLRKASDKPLPRLSTMWKFPSYHEILEQKIQDNKYLMNLIESENPSLIYYYKRKFANDLESRCSLLIRENAYFFGEGFFLGYITFREQALRNRIDQN